MGNRHQGRRAGITRAKKRKKKVLGMFDPEHGKENEKSEMTKKKKKKSFAVVQVPAVYWRKK